MSNNAAVIALLNGTPAAARPHTLPSGKVVDLSPVSVLVFATHVVPRFPSLLEAYTADVAFLASLKAEDVQSCVGPDGNVSDAKLEAMVLSRMEVARMARDSAAEQTRIAAAIVAASLGHPGDEEVEDGVLRLDDDDFESVLAEANERTFAKLGAEGFSEAVAARLKGARLPARSETSPEPGSTRSSRTTRKTRATTKKVA